MGHNREIPATRTNLYGFANRQDNQRAPAIHGSRQASSLQIPPCLPDRYAGRTAGIRRNASLTVRFPVLPRYANPLGHMQGGYIVAALDNTLGPFSYLIAPPSVTSSLNTQYLRPVTRETSFIVCVARLTERTRGNVVLDRRGAQPGRQGRGVVPGGLPDSVCEELRRLLGGKGLTF